MNGKFVFSSNILSSLLQSSLYNALRALECSFNDVSRMTTPEYNYSISKDVRIAYLKN